MTAMHRIELEALYDDVLCSRRLLAHPFYRRWEAGELAVEELAAYATEYRHFEAALPGVLEAIADGLAPGRPRSLVAANLADERGVPTAHLALFDRFAAAVGAAPGPAGPAAAALVAEYRRAAASGAVAGLAAVCAYEVQAPAIAVSKAAGLLAHYGLDGDATRFWDVHGEVDEAHGEWMLEALGAVATDASEVRVAAVAAAEAWWRFLDERQAAAAPTAA